MVGFIYAHDGRVDAHQHLKTSKVLPQPHSIPPLCETDRRVCFTGVTTVSVQWDLGIGYRQSCEEEYWKVTRREYYSYLNRGGRHNKDWYQRLPNFLHPGSLTRTIWMVLFFSLILTEPLIRILMLPLLWVEKTPTNTPHGIATKKILWTKKHFPHKQWLLTGHL